MFLASLGIGGERLKIRADHRGDAATLRIPGDLSGGSPSAAEVPPAGPPAQSSA